MANHRVESGKLFILRLISIIKRNRLKIKITDQNASMLLKHLELWITGFHLANAQKEKGQSGL